MSTYDIDSGIEQNACLNRRAFLGALGAGFGVTALGLMNLNEASAEEMETSSTVKSGKKAVLFDASKCIGCHYCEAGCKNSNELSGIVDLNIMALSGSVIPKALMPVEMFINADAVDPVLEDDRDAGRWLRVTQKTVKSGSKENPEDIFIRHACTHCGLCAQACPSKALTQRKDGIVTMDSSLCIGCFYCYQACPFDIPRYRTEGEDKAMQKCTMCSDRVDEGEKPACVNACPAEALAFGDIEDMIKTGREATSDLVNSGYRDAYLYGENELGGIGMLCVLSHGPKTYGLPELPLT